MRKLVLLCFLLKAGSVYCQLIPNADFEGWNQKISEVLKNWELYGKTSKAAGKFGGNALRLTNNAVLGNASYAFQSVVDTNSFFFKGPAFAFAGTPDSMTITYRAALQADTAYMQVSFTKTGNLFPITYDQFEFSGTSGIWKTVTLPVTYVNLTDSIIADSGWIYIQSADDIDGPYSNGYIEIDNISFIYKNHTTVSAVPNENFDIWDTYKVEMPDAWATPALFLRNGGQHFNYTCLTTDKHKGSAAIKLQGFALANPKTLLSDTFPGFAITLKSSTLTDFSDIDINSPGFPVSQRFQSIRGFFKSNLVNNDQLTVMVNFFKADSVVGSAVMINTSSQNSWTGFAEDIAWDSLYSGMPDSATILMMVSDSLLRNIGSLNSWAILDDLQLDNYTSGLNSINKTKLNARVYPNPSNGQISIRMFLQKEGSVNLSLQNLQGQVLIETSEFAPQGMSTFPLNLEKLNAGIYTLTIETENGYHTEKIIFNP